MSDISPPGIETFAYTYDNLITGEHGKVVARNFTVLADALATVPLARGTLMKVDTGKLVKFTAATVGLTDEIVVLAETIPVAKLVAGDVFSYGYIAGEFLRSAVVGYQATQEQGLNVHGIYTYAPVPKGI